MSVPADLAPQSPVAPSRAGAAPAMALLLLLCAPIFFFQLGRPGLGDPDEGRNAEAAREMLVSGDWVTPRIDGVVYLDKPPAFFWVVAASLRMLGVSELSARAPSAVFALATIAVVFASARRRLGTMGARLAALTLALSPLFIVFGRIVIFDMMLTFCMTVAALAAFAALESETPRARHGLAFFAAAGVGTICKGPVALVVPLLVAVAWSLVRGRPGALKRLCFGRGALVYVAVVLPWLLLVESRNPGYLRYAIVGENLQRMTSNRFETARPFFFYAKVVLPGLFPWILLCLVAGARRARAVFRGRPFGEAWRAARERLARETDARRLLLAYATTWLLVLLLFFSLVASKRPSYMLPCSVPVALLAGHLWARAFERRGGAGDPASDAGASRASLSTGLAGIAVLCAAAGIVALLAGPAGLGRGFSEGKYDALLSQRLLFGGTAAGLLAAAALLVATRRLLRPAAAYGAAVLSIAVAVPLAHAASGYLDEARSSRPVSRYLAPRLAPDDIVLCYEQYRPGLNFYLRRPIHLVTTGTPFSSWYIKAHLEEMSRDPGFPILSSEQMRRLLEAPSPNLYVLAPRRMYDRMRQEAGGALAPDPVYEDLGAGVFVRASGRREPFAGPANPLGDAQSGVLSCASHPGAGTVFPGAD